MRRKKILEEVTVDSCDVNVDQWPDVLIDNFDNQDKEIFLRRKQAVTMYMQDEKMDDIQESTGLYRMDIIRFVKRCLQRDDNGQIWGYRGIIPQKKLTTYSRQTPPPSTTDIKTPTKLTGAFQWLLRTYPSIDETIRDYYFRRQKKAVTEPIIQIKHLHKRFLDSCRSVGITINDYPFNTKDKARRSLYRYTKQLEENYPRQASTRYGDQTERRLKSTAAGQRNALHTEKPFQRVEFDGHALDVILAIKFTNIHGDEIVEIMERIWLLAIIDVATRAILGYHICLHSQYSANDVLECIHNAIVPRQPKALTIPGLKYPDRGGFHSITIPTAAWALWDEFCYDNAKSNLAEIVRTRLKETVGCHVNAGPVSMPERRGIIERFFGLLEANGFHRLPNTTGSQPSDPKRKEPEKHAVQYEITIDELEQLTEVLIANYNHEPHSGLNYLSPLEVMDQRVNNRDMLPRVMPEESREDLNLLTLTAKRTIRGSLNHGKRPYITYEGVSYRSEVLSRNFSLIGDELQLVVNTKDLRVIHAYLNDGSDFGFLTAAGKWGVVPHSLQMRKQINQLINRKLLYITETDDPIELFQRYLEKEATTKKKPRNQIETNRRQNKQHAEQAHIETPSKVTIDEPIFTRDQLSQKRSQKQDDLLELRNRFKTITF